MKTSYLLKGTTLMAFVLGFLAACQKSVVDESNKASNDPAITEAGVYRTGITLDNGSVLAGGVTVTAPTTVNANETFSILAEVDCGRIAIERGYILDANNVKIYHDLDCNSANLLWEEVVTFKCYTVDASWTGSLNQGGTYVYRTKHNGADGNCDGLGGNNTSGNCSHNGNEFYCFTIEVVACATEFSGEAVACGNQREAVYRFTSLNGENYIKIQGGLTNFTGGDAVVTITGGNLTASQSTPGGSSNRIIKIEGSVAACEEVVIRITWNSTNSGGVITGDWSVKDENEVELAPPVAGLECI